MSSKNFEQMEFLLLILKLLLDELLYQFFQLRFPWFGYEWLLEKNLVNKSIDVRSKTKTFSYAVIITRSNFSE